jgi:hypothetical protein
MQMRAIIDRKPSAREAESLRDPLQLQRERKLWSFLTWAFLLAQIAIAEKLFGSSAQAAIDEEAVSGEADIADGQAGASGDIADVAGFTGENAHEGAAEAPGEAGRFELSANTPAEDLPEVENPAGGDTLGTDVPVSVNDTGSTAPQSQPAVATPADNWDTNAPDLYDPGDRLTDTASDLPNTNITLDLGLDTSIVADLLDQLGLDALGLVGDVSDLAFSAVDGLVAPFIDSPIIASLTDTLNGIPIIGGTLQNANDLSTQNGQQSDFMIALTLPYGDQGDTQVSQGFAHDLPIIGDALHQDTEDEDLSELAAIHEALDANTSLIDNPFQPNGWVSL